GYFIRKATAKQKADALESKISKMTEEAKDKTRSLIEKAKEESLAILDEARKEERERKAQITKLEEHLLKREDTLEKRLEKQEKDEKDLREKVEKVKSVHEEVNNIKQKQIEKLEEISGLSETKAKDAVFEMVEQKNKDDLLIRMKKLEQQTNDEVEKKAKEILTDAMQRFSGSQAGEVTTTTLKIPSDEIKGKIIGREGRNIKAIEKMTGAEIIVDDTPGAVLISCFDPIRRQVCRLALEKLISDGRIQPAKIEGAVEQAKIEITKSIQKAGEDAIAEAKVIGVDPKLVNLLGRLKYRTSFGQNVLEHSLEAVHIGAMLATELGADVKITRMGALFHDIGKAVDHEVQGTHVEIGIKILQKFGIDERVILAMRSHHDEYPYETIESKIVATAEALSASRPGARRGTLETYIRRLEELEAIAMSHEGIEKAYAISAGRELRVFVTPEKVDDLGARKLARSIADKIEEELKYPGEIRVNVIRENRVIEYAR
ncbi:ribonuclease Y, partial [Candidatus Azambacteria bacterium]|nr:ribonuclease Y [Candidatus Azambacteria bacterium]